MSLIETINTDRLLGERMDRRHFDHLRLMGRDARVMRTLSPDGNAVSDDVTERFVNQHVDHWDHHGFGLWVFRDPQDSCFVGRGGLHHCHVLDADEIEVAYALMPEYWGKGLATEIAKASVAVAFEQLGIGELIGAAARGHRGSCAGSCAGSGPFFRFSIPGEGGNLLRFDALLVSPGGVFCCQSPRLAVGCFILPYVFCSLQQSTVFRDAPRREMGWLLRAQDEPS